MTIVSSFGEPLEFCCDGATCGFVFETHSDNFRQALTEIKKHNWTVRSYLDIEKRRIWIHLCGDCNGKNAVSARKRRLGDQAPP